MSIGEATSMLREGIFETLLLASPLLVSALVVGLVVAILQATTSIQEQTLTFVPKIMTILGVLGVLGSWIFARMSQYTTTLFGMISRMAE